MDEAFLHKLAGQIAALQIQVVIMRSFLGQCGVSLDDLDRATEDAINGQLLQDASRRLFEEWRSVGALPH